MYARFLSFLMFTAVGQLSTPPPALLAQSSRAANAEMSGPEIAARLAALRQGSRYIRMRMETGNSVLQIQVKERRSPGKTELVYQVLFPKERKGESVLLTKSVNRAAEGTHLLPPNEMLPISSTNITEPLFGSELSYEDIVEDFYVWSHQEIVGTDVIDRIPCQILESKPGKGDRSSYTSVRTWVDKGRVVPLRIEKYRGDKNLVRRIETTQIVTASSKPIPSNLRIKGPSGKITELDGSRIRNGVKFSEGEFTPAGLSDLRSSSSSGE